MLFTRWLTFFTVFLSFQSQFAGATFQFEPITAVLEPAGPKATFSFSVTNDGDKKCPIQITLFHRKPDEKGKEQYVESPDIDELFQIYPSQMILAPNEKRTVRVAYRGDPAIKQELPFRIIAEEFPVNLEDPNKKYTKAEASVSMLLKYVASLYVKPKNAEPDIVATGTPTKDKPPKMLIELKNQGTAHLLIKKVKITFSAGAEKSAALSPDDVSTFFMSNVLPGKIRQYVVAWPKTLPVGPIKVNFEIPKD